MADPASRAFTVKAIVENADYAIRPGMIAEVTFSIADDRKVITVGSSALLRTPDGQPYVYVADKERGQAFRREVALGAVRGSRIEVSSGLAAGETVVTGGAGKLSNGSRINIRK
ncbi:MAG: efflux RND transporter periplasmic adaptor subunit, partial [Prevotella sp.]